MNIKSLAEKFSYDNLSEDNNSNSNSNYNYNRSKSLTKENIANRYYNYEEHLESKLNRNNNNNNNTNRYLIPKTKYDTLEKEAQKSKIIFFIIFL